MLASSVLTVGLTSAWSTPETLTACATVADKAGNCVLKYVFNLGQALRSELMYLLNRGTTRAFGPLMARAATLTIVEADKIVEVGGRFRCHSIQLSCVSDGLGPLQRSTPTT